MQKKTKPILRIVFIILSFISLFLVFYLIYFGKEKHSWVFQVNGENVWEEEVVLLAEQNYIKLRSQVLSLYGQNQYIKEALKELIIRQKVQQIWAKQLNIISSADYYDIQKDMNEINAENQKAMEEGKVVYGLTSYDLSQYYSHNFNNMVLALKNSIKNDENIIDDKAVETYYIKFKDEKFKNPDDKKFYRILADKTDEKYSDLKALEYSSLEETEEYINNRPGLKTEIIIMNKDNFRDLAKEDESLTALLTNLKAGNWSEIGESEAQYYRIYCQSAVSAGYMSMEDVSNYIRNALTEELYEEEITMLTEEASVISFDRIWEELNFAYLFPH